MQSLFYWPNRLRGLSAYRYPSQPLSVLPALCLSGPLPYREITAMEQRRKIRFPLNLKLDILDPTAEPLSLKTIDISSGGVRFRAEKNIPVGHRIEYLVTLVDNPMSVAIKCNGRVVRNLSSDTCFEIAATVERHETLRKTVGRS